MHSQTIAEHLSAAGVSRRRFMKLCGLLATTLALPARYADRIATALAQTTRPSVVWLSFQECTADSESLLRAVARPDPNIANTTDPGIVELLLDVISLDYHEALMAPAGAMAEKSLSDVLATRAGQYICVVEGAIPAGANGAYCVIGGRSAISIAQEVCAGARLTLAVGGCASDGGLPAAAPNPTGAISLATLMPGLVTANKLIHLPGCPANVVNIVATLVYFLTFQELPPLDEQRRPLFAYGQEIHDRCPRRQHYNAGRFVLAWGDPGHRRGWCLYRMGCRGPETGSNCPTVKWNDGVNWPVGAGHPCVGCTEAHFWDEMSPFYVAR